MKIKKIVIGLKNDLIQWNPTKINIVPTDDSNINIEDAVNIVQTELHKIENANNRVYMIHIE